MRSLTNEYSLISVSFILSGNGVDVHFALYHKNDIITGGENSKSEESLQEGAEVIIHHDRAGRGPEREQILPSKVQIEVEGDLHQWQRGDKGSQ
jgi:uncharacterized membrane-anchored protein